MDNNEIRIVIDDETAQRLTRAIEWQEGDSPEAKMYPSDEYSFSSDFDDGHHVELHVYGGEYDGVVAMMLLFDEEYSEVAESGDESSIWGTWQLVSDVTGEAYFVEVLAQSDL